MWVVVPPKAMPRVSSSGPRVIDGCSGWLMMGWARCVCGSMPPGTTISPEASSTRAASAGSAPACPSAAMRSPSTPMSHDPTPCGVTTCPPRTIRSSMRRRLSPYGGTIIWGAPTWPPIPPFARGPPAEPGPPLDIAPDLAARHRPPSPPSLGVPRLSRGPPRYRARLGAPTSPRYPFASLRAARLDRGPPAVARQLRRPYTAPSRRLRRGWFGVGGDGTMNAKWRRPRGVNRGRLLPIQSR